MQKHLVTFSVPSFLLLLPVAALAHTGVGTTAGLFAGFSHPFSGVDHLLAMIAVGLWAAQMGGRALWAVPAAFVGMMLGGAVLGFIGVAIPFVEQSILVSVLVLGLLIAGAFKLPLHISASVVALFALFHGYAHGAEMAVADHFGLYSLGFAVASALLHGVGITLGTALKQLGYSFIPRFAGAAIALSGVYLAIS